MRLDCSLTLVQRAEREQRVGTKRFNSFETIRFSFASFVGPKAFRLHLDCNCCKYTGRVNKLVNYVNIKYWIMQPKNSNIWVSLSRLSPNLIQLLNSWNVNKSDVRSKWNRFVQKINKLLAFLIGIRLEPSSVSASPLLSLTVHRVKWSLDESIDWGARPIIWFLKKAPFKVTSKHQYFPTITV